MDIPQFIYKSFCFDNENKIFFSLSDYEVKATKLEGFNLTPKMIIYQKDIVENKIRQITYDTKNNLFFILEFGSKRIKIFKIEYAESLPIQFIPYIEIGNDKCDIECFDYNNETGLLFVILVDGSVWIYKPNDGYTNFELILEKEKIYEFDIYKILYNNDKNILITAGTDNGKDILLKIFKFKEGLNDWELIGDKRNIHDSFLRSIIYDNDTGYIFIGFYDGTIKIIKTNIDDWTIDVIYQ